MPKILYILIAVFCVFAIIAGVYAQFVNGSTNITNVSASENEVESEKTAETIQADFDDLFINALNTNGYDTVSIVRINSDEEIIYSIDREETTDGYEVDIHIPAINIKSDVVSTFNTTTQEIFADKATEVLSKTDTTTKTIYSVDYAAFINDNILSVVIKSTLKEGQSAQRVMVQTYNYDLEADEEVTLVDLITKKSINTEDANAEIQSVVGEAADEAALIESMGYNQVFTRDVTSDTYTVENSNTFFLANNGELYIVYAYGNQNFTSEMDIVIFE